MFSVAWFKATMKRFAHPWFSYGVDRDWRSWRAHVFPKVVEQGPPADLSKKETRRGAEEFLVDIC